MTESENNPAHAAPPRGPSKKAEARAAALRANLMKRKQQTRGRTAQDPASDKQTSDTQNEKED